MIQEVRRAVQRVASKIDHVRLSELRSESKDGGGVRSRVVLSFQTPAAD